MALGALLAAVPALVELTITDPRVSVRWRPEVTPSERAAREERYSLRNGEPDGDTGPATWWYDLADRSRGNIKALVSDAAVEDTGYIDRGALTARDRNVRMALRPYAQPIVELFAPESDFRQLHRSLWLFLAGATLLRAARAARERFRRNTTVAALLVLAVTMMAFPFEASHVTMGEANERASREQFESYYAGRVRYEKHLSQTILLHLYLAEEPTEDAPGRAMVALGRLAAAWFALSVLAIGFLERWSPVVVRYVALCVLAPSALLYFGWREFAYLSLSVATVPLLARGLRDGNRRLEAASVTAGLGAALHGSGLVSLAGVWMAALGTSARVKDWAGRLLRTVAWGIAAYAGWVAVYMIALNLPIQPGSARRMWRPLLADEVREGRISPAILSALGLRDLSIEACIVGLPLLVFAVSLARRHGHELRVALWYLVPSMLFLIFRWPFTGVGPGIDLVAAGFPALYALAWVCAHDARRTLLAAVMLASAHVAFWWVVFDSRFEVMIVN